MVTWTHKLMFLTILACKGCSEIRSRSQNHMFIHPTGEWASFNCPAPLSPLLLPLCPVTSSTVLWCNCFVSMSVYLNEWRAKQNQVVRFSGSQSLSRSSAFSRRSSNVEWTNENKIEKADPVIIWLLRLGKQHHQCIITLIIWVISGNQV